MATKTDEFVIGTKEEAFWKKIKDNCEAQLLENEQSSILLRANLEIAEQKLKEYAC